MYRYVLAGKGTVTARQSLARLQRSRPELTPIFETLQRVSARLASLSLSIPDPKQRETRLQQIGVLTEQREALERELASKNATLRQTEELLQLGPDAFKRTLPPKTALVDVLEYTFFSPPTAGKGKLDETKRLVAFVLRSDAEIKRVELGPTEPITKAVGEWRRSYDRRDTSRPGMDLRSLVWKPLESHLVGVDTVVVSPDGPLCWLPVSALPGSEPDTYLIEERNIVVFPVPRATNRFFWWET